MISSRFTAALAAVAVAALAVPASADPVTGPAPAANAEVKPPLSRKAAKLVWCVKPKGAPADAKKECKTREAWIKEGKDPFGQY